MGKERGKNYTKKDKKGKKTCALAKSPTKNVPLHHGNHYSVTHRMAARPMVGRP